MKRQFKDRLQVMGYNDIINDVSPVSYMRRRAVEMFERGTTQGYNLVQFNCECFMHYVVMNKWISLQSGFVDCCRSPRVEADPSAFMNRPAFDGEIDLRLGAEDFLFEWHFHGPGTFSGLDEFLSKLEEHRYQWKRSEARWMRSVVIRE